MRDNPLLSTLRGGAVATGVFVTLSDIFASELLARAGFDAVIIDTEHAAIGVDQLQTLLTAMYPAEATALVRVAANDAVPIQQALDLGAEGLLVPGISSASDCARMVSYARYRPRGERGFGPRRASRLHGDRADYLSRVEDQLALFAMVESQAGVDAIEEIVAVEGLSGVYIGVADLAVSMGLLRDMGNPAVDEAAARVAAAAAAAGLPFGVLAATESGARTWIDRGARLLVLGSDLQFLETGTAAARAVARKLLADE